MSLAIDVLEPSALLIVCQVLDGALLTRLRGVKPGIGGAVNVRFCLRPDSGNQPPPQPWSNGQNRPFYARENDHRAGLTRLTAAFRLLQLRKILKYCPGLVDHSKEINDRDRKSTRLNSSHVR